MIPVPELNKTDEIFGNIKYLPKMEDIPEKFHGGSKIIRKWFYHGLVGAKFKARPGVDGRKALAAIQAILASFEPSHEHKMAGCSYLLDEWFEEFGE